VSTIEELWQILKKRFGDTRLQKGAFSAPGRVNLIGEHTDYNDGFVLPMAIEKEITMVGQLRNDLKVAVYSLDYNCEIEFSLAQLTYDQDQIWVNYLKGVIDELKKLNFQLKGINLVFSGNIPQGSGLSSSAALEVVTAYTLASLNNLKLQPVEMALLCQRAENNLVGVNCGIMDQYISRLGQKDHLLMIDCRTNEYELIPFKNRDYRIVICNSKVERGLVDTEYNQRRNECNQAVSFFAERLNHRVDALRDVTLEELNLSASELPSIIFRRARHIISENNRVLIAMAALRNNDLTSFGQLMVESHISLRDDYEVSCQELNYLVDLALKQDGVLGARMTGAGFGGCTVNLVKNESVEEFKRAVSIAYQTETGIKPDLYVSSPADGAKMISSF